MDYLEKADLDQFGSLLKSGMNISKEIADISGVGKLL